MSNLSRWPRWLVPVRQLAAAFFQHDVTLERKRGQVHVVLAERGPNAQAPREKKVPAGDEGERRRRRLQHEELMLVRTELAALLNELPETFRTPIILFYFEEFSYRDIEEQMNVPLGTVMSRLARAKTFLRQRLMGHVDWVEKANQGEDA